MSDKFLGSGGSSSTNLTNGTVPFYGSSLGAESLSPGLPVKVNSLRQLITSKLNISDISGLQTALSNSGIKNPLTSNLNIGVWDIINLPDGKTLRGITDEVGAFDAEIKALDDKTINISSIVGTTTFTGDIKSSSVSTGFLYDESKSVRIEATPTTFDIQAPFLKFNNNPVVSSPYPSLLEANGFLKTGGTNIQYLMANGSTLTQSANSGNSNYYLYNNNTSLSPTPTIGNITFDTATQNTATMIYISHRTRDNVDIEVFFKQISTLTEIYIQDQETSLNYIQYNVLSAPIITPEAQVAISVNLRTGAGTGLTNFGNGHNLLVSFFTNSLEVDTRISNVETKTQYQTGLGGNITGFTGDLLVSGETMSGTFRKTGGVSTEFLKANGTVDSNTYATTTITDGLLSKKLFIKNLTVGIVLGVPYVDICPTVIGNLIIPANSVKQGDIYALTIEGAYTMTSNNARPVIRITIGGVVFNAADIFPSQSGSFGFRFISKFSFFTIGAVSTGSVITTLETGSLSAAVINSQMAFLPGGLPVFNTTIANTVFIEAHSTNTTTVNLVPYFIFLSKI